MPPKVLASARLVQAGLHRPFSALTFLLAVALVVYALFRLVTGSLYLAQLNFIDTTTILMIAALLLRGVICLRKDPDGQAVSIALIGALSFVFAFEAVYKLSFYAYPRRMAPAELRDFLIQIGIALTASAGFAFGKFRFSKASLGFTAIFALGWVIWLALGFPQLPTGRPYYSALIPVPPAWLLTYLLNRLVKLALCLAYYCLYAPPVGGKIGSGAARAAGPAE